MSLNEFQPPVAAHSASPFQVLTARPERIGSREGVLEIELTSAAYTEGEGRIRTLPPDPDDVVRFPVPGTPVLLVDSRPVAEGVGTAWVRLPPGLRHVSVQAAGFAGWWPVEIRAGEVTVFESHPLRAWNSQTELPIVPARFAEEVRYWTILGYLPAAFVMTLLLAAVPACVIGSFFPDLVAAGIGRVIGLGVLAACMAALFAVMTARHLGTMRATKRHLRTHGQLASTPAPAAFRAYRLPPGLAYLPKEAGTEGLLLDLTWEIVWQRIDSGTDIDWRWMQCSGEPGPVRERPWMPDPVVSVDGIEHELAWGRWWVPLDPGEHELEVGVPLANPDDAGDHYLRWHEAIDSTEEWYTRLRLVARAVQHTDHDRAVLHTTGIDAQFKYHITAGRLPDFRTRRLPTEPLDGQTDLRLRHSMIDGHREVPLPPS